MPKPQPKKTTANPPRPTEESATTPEPVSFDALPSRAQARAQAAYARIAGDEGLTGSLTDDAARRLLNWARQEVVRLAAAAEDLEDAAGEAWLTAEMSALRGRLRQIARQSAAAPAPEAAIQTHLLALQRERDQGPRSHGTAIAKAADQDAETAS